MGKCHGSLMHFVGHVHFWWCPPGVFSPFCCFGVPDSSSILLHASSTLNCSQVAWRSDLFRLLEEDSQPAAKWSSAKLQGMTQLEAQIFSWLKASVLCLQGLWKYSYFLFLLILLHPKASVFLNFTMISGALLNPTQKSPRGTGHFFPVGPAPKLKKS